MVGQEVVVGAWKEWGIQALVLLSLTLQITLLVLAEFRRRVRSGPLMFCIWTAYLIADATAIYVLGHMSVTSRTSAAHQLVAFWAPFLLLHLGGQDNITAYSIEDNRLWLRHLQALAVQAAAAGYVLYESSIITGGGQPLLRWATILMFLVGAIKYGERVLALRSASTSAAGKNYHTLTTGMTDDSWEESIEFLDGLANQIHNDAKSVRDTDEARMVFAHRMLSLPKKLLRGSVHSGQSYSIPGGKDDLYKVVEVQMSLIHDTLYTKGEIIHTSCCGRCIRVISAVATGTAFLLFNLQVADHDGYNRVDVAVTYVLFVGAIVLETLSLLRVAFSSWTYAEDKDWDNVWNEWRAYGACYVRRLVGAAAWRGRGWSGSMGQLNLLQLIARSRASRGSKMARWVGLEDPWNTLAYSWSIPVSAYIEKKLADPSYEELVVSDDDDLERGGESAADVLEEEARQEEPLQDLLEDMSSLQDRILALHIATNIYLTWWRHQEDDTTKQQQFSMSTTAEAAEALSNYMVFLLAARPDMVSPTGSRTEYVEMCFALSVVSRLQEEEKEYGGTAEELAAALGRRGEAADAPPSQLLVKPTAHGVDVRSNVSDELEAWKLRRDEGYRRYILPKVLAAGCKLGAMLIRKRAAQTLDSIVIGWMQILVEAATDCSAYAHAKQLSNGGELITVAALLAEYHRTHVHLNVVTKIQGWTKQKPAQ